MFESIHKVKTGMELYIKDTNKSKGNDTYKQRKTRII